MWCTDIILDLDWFSARRGKLGRATASGPLPSNDGEPTLRAFIYGDDEKIRHLRVTIDTDDHDTADRCVNAHINKWIWRLEVASLLATPTFSTAAPLERNSVTFAVTLQHGDENTDTVTIDGLFHLPAAKANFSDAIRLFGCWNTDFENHLGFLSRFLNSALPPDTRWLNGYRFLEWHFQRGSGDLKRNQLYRDFIETHGSSLDPFLRKSQTRIRLMEEIRALVAHALSSKPSDPRTDGGATDLVLKTFSALEGLVVRIANEGTVGGISLSQMIK